MPCTLCDLGQSAWVQMLPTGSRHPDVYVVFDKPTMDCMRFQDYMQDDRGRFIASYLASVGISEVRAFSVIRCPCERNPTDDETEQCLRYLRADVASVEPKVIVTVGSYATQSVTGTDSKITAVRGLVRRVDVGGREYPVLPVYSPTYIKNQPGNTALVSEFQEDMATAMKVATGTYLSPMDRNRMEYALDYETFRRFYEDELAGSPMLAYDIETNAELVYSSKFEICGWSLAREGVGIYVCLDSLDYTMPESDRDRCVELLLRILDETPKVVVHNGLYERPATYYRYGYEIPFDKLEDTLVMAKIMLGGKVGAGLKPNARRIGYPEWDADVVAYVSGFTDCVKRCALKKFQPVVQRIRDGMTFEQAFADLADHAKFAEIEGYYANIRDSVLRYYGEDEAEGVLALASRRFVDAYDGGWTSVIPYSWIPQRMLCRYGATDSLATFDLYNHFMALFAEDSTDEVDLVKGYRFDLMEHYTGYELMLAGLHWDDSLASRDYDVYTRVAEKCLRHLILCGHPAMDARIAESYRARLAPEVVYESYNDWFWEHLQRRVELKDEGQYVSVFVKENGREWRRPAHFLFDGDPEIPETMLADIDRRVLAKARDLVLTADRKELKDVFNPGSPAKWAAEIYDAVVMDDDLRVGFFINRVRDSIIEAEGFNRAALAPVEGQLVDAIERYLAVPASDVRLRALHYAPIRQFVTGPVRFFTEELRVALVESRDLKLDKLAEEYQILVYESLRSTPIDVEDPATWTAPFVWNLCMRLYKKATKLVTSYLDGSVGREAVYVVDAARLGAGEDVVYREEHLRDMPVDERGVPQLPPGKAWLEQTSFGVGTAETGRWRSALHTVPAGTTIKRMFTSRFRGGTIFQPDFSANELRCVASMAHEENMLEAFREGIDIHRSNASKIFRVPLEEVTPFQRRRAKALSFSTLYGGSAASIAESFFNGDMNKAKKQLDDFYSAFPSLKVWIDAKHDEAMRTHKVSTLTHRFISIDFNPTDQQSLSKAMRAAQNYPVQSYDKCTEIIGLDGKKHRIGDLAERQEDLWIYAYDVDCDEVKPIKGVRAQCTGMTDTWYELVLDNGKSVKVTPEHLMMLRDGTYRRADEIEVGTSLMPLYLDRTPEDDHFEPNRLYLPGDLEGRFVHVWAHDSVYGNVPGTSVHHINLDVDDNRPENLLRLSNAGHMAYHRNFYEYCLGTKTLDGFLSSFSDDLRRVYGPRYDERMADVTAFVKSLTDEDRERFASRSMTSRNSRRSVDYPEWDDHQRESARKLVADRLAETGNVLGMDRDAYSKRLSESWDETREYRKKRLKEGHNKPESIKAHSDASKKRESDPNYAFNRIKKQLGFMHENNLPWRTPEDWDESVQRFEPKSSRRRSRYILGKMDWDDFLARADEYLSTYNHKVVDVRVHHLDEPEPKYDLHVPRLHNFALGCGVFSHNSTSSTMAAVVFCDILLHEKELGYKSKGICFIHDSLESDVAPYELIELTEYQQERLANGAVDHFGVQCKADVSMGYSMGHECEMTGFEILDDAKTEANITLEGDRDDVMDTINNWKLAYNVVEVLEEETEDDFTSISELFLARKAYDLTAMSHRKRTRMKVHIRYYDEDGRVAPVTDDLVLVNPWENSPVTQYVLSLPY